MHYQEDIFYLSLAHNVNPHHHIIKFSNKHPPCCHSHLERIPCKHLKSYLFIFFKKKILIKTLTFLWWPKPPLKVLILLKGCTAICHNDRCCLIVSLSLFISCPFCYSICSEKHYPCFDSVLAQVLISRDFESVLALWWLTNIW